MLFVKCGSLNRWQNLRNSVIPYNIPSVEATPPIETTVPSVVEETQTEKVEVIPSQTEQQIQYGNGTAFRAIYEAQGKDGMLISGQYDVENLSKPISFCEASRLALIGINNELGASAKAVRLLVLSVKEK